MRLERFIQVKKMMFIHAIMVLNDQTLSRSIFCERANVILGQGPVEIDESEFSVVQDLLKTTSLFNLLDDVRNMMGFSTQNKPGRIKSGHVPEGWRMCTGMCSSV